MTSLISGDLGTTQQTNKQTLFTYDILMYDEFVSYSYKITFSPEVTKLPVISKLQNRRALYQHKFLKQFKIKIQCWGMEECMR